MSEFQTAKAGHRPQENLFVIKSLMELSEKYNEILILQLIDIEKYFDKEVLVDVLDSAHSNNIGPKEYKLLYKLNEFGFGLEWVRLKLKISQS